MEPKQSEKWKRGKRYVLVGGVLVMLLACFLLGVMVGQRDGEPETALVSASPGPTSTTTQGDALEDASVASTALAFTSTAITLEALEPSETPGPTETAEPTMTPEPTRTAAPTATPPPTSTATPVPTATASSPLTPLRWSQETRAQLEVMGDAERTMGDLMGNPLFDDATWNALLAAQVVKIREADAVLRGIVPPEECREAHEVLLSASGDGLLAAEYSLEWIQEQDPDLIEQVAEYSKSMIAKMNLYRLMIEAMTP